MTVLPFGIVTGEVDTGTPPFHVPETDQSPDTRLLEIAHAEYFELVTLFYGEDTSHTDVIRITDAIRSAYPELEVEVQEGGQPHYQFIVSIE